MIYDPPRRHLVAKSLLCAGRSFVQRSDAAPDNIIREKKKKKKKKIRKRKRKSKIEKQTKLDCEGGREGREPGDDAAMQGMCCNHDFKVVVVREYRPLGRLGYKLILVL